MGDSILFCFCSSPVLHVHLKYWCYSCPYTIGHTTRIAPHFWLTMVNFLFPCGINIVLSSQQVLDMITNPHYLYRMTTLRAISLLAPVMGSEITCSKLLPVITSAAKDRYWVSWGLNYEKTGCILQFGRFELSLDFIFCRVPNIKFNVAKVLQSLISIVDQSVSSYFFTIVAWHVIFALVLLPCHIYFL